MHAGKPFKYLFTLLFMFAVNVTGKAQEFSYVYIQGDKITPFYIKLEGEMLPRYSKNYYIIPQLAAGPIHIQILFQQNEFPSQNYTIQVPENGFRGFLLTRKANEFALYDIQQRFYLLPGDAGEDHLPVMNATTTLRAIAPPPEEPAPVKARGIIEKPKGGRKKFPAQEAREQPKPVEANLSAESKEPVFIDNMELSNEHVATEDQAVVETQAEPQVVSEPETTAVMDQNQLSLEQAQQPVEEARQQEEANPDQVPVAEMSLQANSPAIPNSDCPDPMGDARFDDLFTRTEQKDSDEKRISYLMKHVEGNCFSTRQAALLARKLDAESLRYSFLKKVYPRVTDQQNFPLLEQLFKTTEWKSYFELIQ